MVRSRSVGAWCQVLFSLVLSVCFVQVYPVQVGRLGEGCHVQLSHGRSHCFDSKSFGADSRYGEGGMPPPHYVRT